MTQRNVAAQQEHTQDARTKQRVRDAPYVERIRNMSDDELHAEGFRVARSMSEAREQMTMLSVEMRIRDAGVTPAAIVKAVALALDVPEAQIMGRRRTVAISDARQVAMWTIRQSMHLSLAAIGDFFGRDHTTVLHALRRVERDPRQRDIATALSTALSTASA